LLSMSADRAARKIVEATRRNQAELVIGWQANALIHGHGVSPGLAARALGLVNQLLPKEHDGVAVRRKGHESESAVTRSILTALGRKAAERYNQVEESA
jgi:hypothetical protein